jgi:hypothetical protein
MTLPCPHCSVEVQIEMTELGRTEEIGPAGSAAHRATHRIIAGATHASPVCASFDFAAWFRMSLATMPTSSPSRAQRARGSRIHHLAPQLEIDPPIGIASGE